MNLFSPFATVEERNRPASPKTPKELRKRRLVGLVWTAVWAFPIVSQADDVVRATAWPWLAVVTFAVYLALYLYVVMKGFMRREIRPAPIEVAALAAFTAIGIAISLGFSGETNSGALVTLLYIGVAGVATFVAPTAYYWLLGSIGLIVLVGVLRHASFDDI